MESWRDFRGKYLVIASFTVCEVVFPFLPAVPAKDCDETVDAFLPVRGRFGQGAAVSGIGVSQVLQRGAVRGVVVPD